MAAEPAAPSTSALSSQAPPTTAAAATAATGTAASPDAASQWAEWAEWTEWPEFPAADSNNAATAAVAVDAAAADLGQQLLEVATTLRHSRLPSSVQVVRGLHPVCSTGRSAAVATVTEVRLGCPNARRKAGALARQELPWHLLRSAEHLTVLYVSWELLQQLAAKQHANQSLLALFAPRLQQLVVVGGEMLPDSGAHLALLLQSADSLQALQLESDNGVLSFGTCQTPPVLEQLRSVKVRLRCPCLHTVVPWLQQHRQLQDLHVAMPGEDQATADVRWVSSLTALTSLAVSARALQHLPSSWSALQQLRRMTLNVCHIEELPEELCSSWRALEELNLQWNSLTSLPEALTRLTSLTALDISFNRLTQLPEGLASLPNLVQLSIGHNSELLALPQGLSKLTCLHVMDCTFLTNLRFLTAFPSLAVAHVTGCNLQSRRGVDLSMLTALRELNLRGCNVEAAEGWVLPSSLQRLDLHRHKLTSFKDLQQLSSCCPGLRQLNLTGLSERPPRDVGVLGVFPHLTRLAISWGSSSSRAAAEAGDVQQVRQPLSSWLAQQPQLVELELEGEDMQHLATLPTTLTSLALTPRGQLPPVLLQMPQLRHLDLYSIYLTELPTWFSGLTQLQLLRLNQYSFSRVAEVVMPLMQLHGLQVVQRCRDDDG